MGNQGKIVWQQKSRGDCFWLYGFPYYAVNMFSSEQNCWFVHKVSFITFLHSQKKSTNNANLLVSFSMSVLAHFRVSTELNQNINEEVKVAITLDLKIPKSKG